MTDIYCNRDRQCRTMAEHLHETETRKGFNLVWTLNIKTGEDRFIGIRYCATAKRSDKGVMLNFCPWCGESLEFWVQEPSQPTAQPQGDK